MRVLYKASLLAVAAALVSVPLTIAIDLALYDALADHLSDRHMRIAIDSIDKTEMSRTIGFFLLLMLWGGVVFCVNKVVDYLCARKKVPTVQMN